MKKIVIGLLAALTLSWAQTAYAVDNATEFGIEDDLTVLGNAGTALDPDAEIKGFTVFGATQAAYTGAVVGAGNVVVNGYLAVSSGAYFVGGSTFAAGGAYFTGISSFSSPGGIYVGGNGTLNQVLKKAAGGGMVWGDDNLGAGEITGTPRRLVMFQTDGGGGSDSLLQQDNSDLSITMITGSSMTILGNGTLGLGVTGATALNGNTSILNANTFTVGTGLATLGGALNVNGDVDLNAKLNVDGTSTFVSSVTAQGIVQLGDLPGTDYVGVNGAGDATTALKVTGQDASNQFSAKFYSGTNLAAWIKKK